MKKSKIKTVAAGLLCLGLAGASSWAAETIESSAMGAGQMYDGAILKMPLAKGQNGQAVQTLKGLKNIKASARKLGLTLAKEKKAAAKCDVTVPGCRESMAVPEYKATSSDESKRDISGGTMRGLVGGIAMGATPGLEAATPFIYLVNKNPALAAATGVFLLPLAIAGIAVAGAGALIGGIFGTATGAVAETVKPGSTGNWPSSYNWVENEGAWEVN